MDVKILYLDTSVPGAVVGDGIPNCVGATTESFSHIRSGMFDIFPKSTASGRVTLNVRPMRSVLGCALHLLATPEVYSLNGCFEHRSQLTG